MVGLGRWLIAGSAALGIGAIAALVRRRRVVARPDVRAPTPPPESERRGDPEAALDAARSRLRARADEVKARLEDHSS